MAGESKNFNYKGEGKASISGKGETGMIATSASSVGTFQEHVYPDTVGSGEMVKWAAGATGELAPTQFIEVVTETVERSRGLESGFKLWFNLPNAIGGGIGFEKPARKETKTTTKEFKRKD